MRVQGSSLARSGAAAGGAVVGTLFALVAGKYFAGPLLARVGGSMIDDVLTKVGTGELAGLGAIFAVFATMLVGLVVMAALIAPIFIVVPLALLGIVLRLTRADLIMRTIWLTLATGIVLVITGTLALSTLDVTPGQWFWFVIVAAAAFFARLLVEVGRIEEPVS